MELIEGDIRLVLKSPGEVREFIQSLPPDVKKEMSDVWLELVESTDQADPWVHGFSIQLISSGELIGNGGFKGPPDSGGDVEIAYGIDPAFQGKGFASLAAQALTKYAISEPDVTSVIAHTLAENNASTRVLTKCGYQFCGEVVHPEDGNVWKWQFPSQL